MQPPILQRIVDLIVSEVSPDQIILFGSHARGDARENSDIDLLVLKKGLEDEGGTTDKIYDVLFDNKIAVPVDVLAYDYSKYIKYSDVIGYVFKTIKKEGKVLYESIY